MTGGRRPLSDEEILAQIPAARERARVAAATEPRAAAARYDAASGLVEIDLRNGCRFAFPAEYGQGLRGATADQLAAVEVTPDGYGLHWEELDVDMAVWALLAGHFGSDRWMEQWGGSGWAARPAAEPAEEPRVRRRRAS